VISASVSAVTPENLCQLALMLSEDMIETIKKLE
jgi:hypothetical protein